MANIQETGIPGIGDGILMPLLEHRFMVRFGERDFTEEGVDLISKQTIMISQDAVDKTLYTEIEQPLAFADQFFELISDLATNRIEIDLYATDGNGEKAILATFKHCQCIKHNFELNYANSGIATHKMTFSYDPRLAFLRARTDNLKT